MAQVVDNSVIAVDTGISLTLRHKFCIAISKLACTRNEGNPFEVQNPFIPSRSCHVKLCNKRSCTSFAMVGRSAMNGFFVLEVLHCGSFSLYDNEIDPWSYFISLRIEDITLCIFADVSFQLWVHANIINTG